jgi:hypothetical protein
MSAALPVMATSIYHAPPVQYRKDAIVLESSAVLEDASQSMG